MKKAGIAAYDAGLFERSDTLAQAPIRLCPQTRSTLPETPPAPGVHRKVMVSATSPGVPP